MAKKIKRKKEKVAVGFEGTSSLIKGGTKKLAIGTAISLGGLSFTEKARKIGPKTIRGGKFSTIGSGLLIGGALLSTTGGSAIGAGLGRKLSGVKERELVTEPKKIAAVIGGSLLGAFLAPGLAFTGSLIGLAKLAKFRKGQKFRKSRATREAAEKRAAETTGRKVKGVVISKKGKVIFRRVRGRIIPIRLKLSAK